jgi:hypothetical protein
MAKFFKDYIFKSTVDKLKTWNSIDDKKNIPDFNYFERTLKD